MLDFGASVLRHCDGASNCMVETQRKIAIERVEVGCTLEGATQAVFMWPPQSMATTLRALSRLSSRAQKRDEDEQKTITTSQTLETPSPRQEQCSMLLLPDG